MNSKTLFLSCGHKLNVWRLIHRTKESACSQVLEADPLLHHDWLDWNVGCSSCWCLMFLYCFAPRWHTRLNGCWTRVICLSGGGCCLGRENFVGRCDESLPAFAFFSSFFFNARISPQWLSELRWLRQSVSWRVACELVFPDRFPHYTWTA